MNASHRADLINKLQKILKKHYKPASPPADRTVLEHLLYACCLENATFEAADEAFAKVQQLFFDWNEIRVTTVRELAESMESVPDAIAAATRMKQCLQSVFEGQYSFDLEAMKKQNIGKTQQDLAKYQGVTPFAIEYVTQHALGGHAIPLCRGTLEVLAVLDVISEADVAKRHVPGLERLIPKNKGIEFASLLHQLGVDFGISPHGTKIRNLLLEIDPQVKDRMPKRGTKKEDEPASTADKTRETKGKPAKEPESAKGKEMEKANSKAKDRPTLNPNLGKDRLAAESAKARKDKPAEPNAGQKGLGKSSNSASHAEVSSKPLAKKKPK